MKVKLILFGSLFYVVVTFPLAVIWHVVLFKPFYESIGYFGAEPNFLLGFLAILTQGVLLSFGFSLLPSDGAPMKKALKYAFFMGVFFWTSHVLAAAAKHASANVMQFYLMETFYLFLQFGIYGTLIGFCRHRMESSS